jgi:cytochrome c-type biogenesis protein
MTENLSFLLAFTAGLLTFASPCILPLIPSYLFVIGSSPLTGTIHQPGSSDDEPGYKKSRPRPVARTVSFILGFSVIFITLSIIFSTTFSLMGNVQKYINLVSGIIVIILGLNIIFNFLSFLNYEKRLHLKNKPKGVIGAFLVGAAFGAGWMPCVGPVLASILLLAANSQSIPLAVLYLMAFSIGLGLPFLFASFCFDAFLSFSIKIRKHILLIQRICGGLLIVTGIFIISGRYQELSSIAAQWAARLTAQ